jgi:hypothetical protein
MNDLGLRGDSFAHLNQRASERADRTVERLRTGIAALEATGQKITAESLKQITRELEPGFAGLSFQVIRRNPRAYALYREAASAFSATATPDQQLKRLQRRARRAARRTPRSSYDPLQRLDTRTLVRRIRSLEHELDGIAHDKVGLPLRREVEYVACQRFSGRASQVAQVGAQLPSRIPRSPFVSAMLQLQ